jgi:hypothetical protein
MIKNTQKCVFFIIKTTKCKFSLYFHENVLQYISPKKKVINFRRGWIFYKRGDIHMNKSRKNVFYYLGQMFLTVFLLHERN